MLQHIQKNLILSQMGIDRWVIRAQQTDFVDITSIEAQATNKQQQHKAHNVLKDTNNLTLIANIDLQSTSPLITNADASAQIGSQLNDSQTNKVEHRNTAASSFDCVYSDNVNTNIISTNIISTDISDDENDSTNVLPNTAARINQAAVITEDISSGSGSGTGTGTESVNEAVNHVVSVDTVKPFCLQAIGYNKSILLVDSSKLDENEHALWQAITNALTKNNLSNKHNDNLHTKINDNKDKVEKLTFPICNGMQSLDVAQVTMMGFLHKVGQQSCTNGQLLQIIKLNDCIEQNLEQELKQKLKQITNIHTHSLSSMLAMPLQKQALWQLLTRHSIGNN